MPNTRGTHASDNRKGMSPMAAGLVGAAVGAAVGVAAVELANEENRKMVGEKMGELKEAGGKVYNRVKETASDVKERTEEALGDGEEKMERAMARKPRR